jgi:hypothetical protein
MHQSLPELLFPEYRRRVLGLLLLRPDEALHGREIARRTGLPDGTITRELGKLAKPKQFLVGNAHDLEELARHQP